MVYLLPWEILGYYYYYMHEVVKVLPIGHKTKVFGAVMAYYLFFIVLQSLKYWKNIRKIKNRQEKRRFRFAKFGIATADMSIMDVPLAQLVDHLQKGKLKPTEVMNAYQQKVVEVNIEVNAVADVILQSIKDAAILDHKPSGLLHGVPISVVESLFVKHFDVTLGLSCYIGQKVDYDAVVLRVLKYQGAVPFARTNIPQTSIVFGSSNPIFGQTKNPVDKHRSPGGCTSGEGSIIASGASCLGVGCDCSGGIRIPAHFCGVCSLKPTSSRISCKGMRYLLSGRQTVPVSIGPLSQDVYGLELFMRAVCVPYQRCLDANIPPIEFQEAMFSSSDPLVIGYYTDDGCFQSVPAVARAVMEAKNILEKCGHMVVPFSLPDMQHFLELLLQVSMADDPDGLFKLLSTDVIDPCIKTWYRFLQMPHMFRLLYFWFNHYKQNPLKATMSYASPPWTIAEWNELQGKIQNFQADFMVNWQLNKVDVVICPVLPFAALQLGNEAAFEGCVTHTFLYNIVDYPAGTVPITTVTQKDVEDLSDPEIYSVTTTIDERIKQDQEGNEKLGLPSSKGLPVSIQCVALPFQEEKVLRVMKQLQQKCAFKSTLTTCS